MEDREPFIVKVEGADEEGEDLILLRFVPGSIGEVGEQECLFVFEHWGDVVGYG